MKKNWLYMFAIAMASTFFVACSSDDTIDEVVTPPTTSTETPQGKQVVLSGSFGARSSAVDESRGTRAVDANGKVTWASGDKFSVGYKKTNGTYAKAEGEVTVIMDDENHMAKFNCTLTDPDFSEDIRFIYPSSAATADGRAYETSGLLNNQKGTIADISANWDIAMKDVKAHLVDGELRAEVDETIKLENQLCICELNLKLNSSNARGNKLTITDGTHTYVVVPTNPDGISKFTVALIPVSGQNFEFTVNTSKSNLKYTYYKELSEVAASETDALGKFVTSDGKVWTVGNEPIVYYRKSNGVTLAKNKYYKLDLNVHNEGTIYPIGIIAWLGTDAELTCGKNHGLVMGLSYELNNRAWTQEGFGDEDFESFFTNGNVESISDCESKYVNGAYYTNLISASHGSHEHPLFDGFKTFRDGENITIPGTENWFVPSIAQWLAVLGNNGLGKFTGAWNWADAFTASSSTAYTNITNALTENFPFSDFTYWTSTQADDLRAACVTFSATEGIKVYMKSKYQNGNTTIRPFFAF